MKLLKDIIPVEGVLEIIGRVDMIVPALHFDSRKVDKGSMFFAIKGTTSDGYDFIPVSVEKGAAIVVCEQLPDQKIEEVTYIKVKDCNKAMGEIASAFYDHPSDKLNLVGVTGTNGKTTTATLLYELFRKLGFKTGLISTILNKIEDIEIKTTHTTPDTLLLNELLALMVNEGCNYCFMEVSSHSISQQRIAGLTFRGGIFTNITHDHLDYHKTFDAYLAAKKTFFDTLSGESFALINKDDRNGMVMVQNTKANVSTYSLHSMADFRCRIIENQFEGLQLEIEGIDCWFKLIGSFNAYIGVFLS